MRAKPGKRLGGKPRSVRRGRGMPRDDGERKGAAGLLFVLAVALFVVGGVAGFGWALDEQLRGGLLEQRREAIQRPDWVRLQSLPPYVPAAFVSVVDPSFFEGGALRTGGRGTTIARDLVSQVHQLDHGLGGEARELVLAPLLEQRRSKEDILELYLNRVFLGEASGYPVYGIHHAAEEYFGKRPAELTLSEVATLAGLLLPPRVVDPDRSVGAVGARRNEVLRVLLERGDITPQQYSAAVREPLAFQPGLDQEPMTRPAGWMERPTVLQLPENRLPAPDSAETQ